MTISELFFYVGLAIICIIFICTFFGVEVLRYRMEWSCYCICSWLC